MKRTISLLLVFALLLSVLPMQALAVGETAADADFDGIPDALDVSPNDNEFTGTYKSGDYTINVDYVMDYRNFFGDNTVYNR